MAATIKRPIDPSWGWELLVFHHQTAETIKKAKATMKGKRCDSPKSKTSK